MIERKFGRNHQHHFEFGPGADRRPRRLVGRARRADGFPRFRGEAVRARQRDDQLDPARIVRDRSPESRPRPRGGATEVSVDLRAPIQRRESRSGNSAIRTSSARFAPFSPAPTRDLSRVRTSSSMAAPSRVLFEAARLGGTPSRRLDLVHLVRARRRAYIAFVLAG